MRRVPSRRPFLIGRRPLLTASDVLDKDAERFIHGDETARDHANKLVAELQSSGYDPEQIQALLRALVTHEPAAVQRAFGIYDEDGQGSIERTELMRSIEPLTAAVKGSRCGAG